MLQCLEQCVLAQGIDVSVLFSNAGEQLPQSYSKPILASTSSSLEVILLTKNVPSTQDDCRKKRFTISKSIEQF